MATETQRGPFARKPTETLVREAGGDDEGLQRAVGALDLTALGIGAIIGTGIFVIIGEAIALSGPSIVLSFALAGVTCLFSALSYGELASTIPVSGSAYTYGYATLGELRGVDHRLGPDPRVRRVGRRRRRRLGRLPAEPARLAVRDQPARLARRPARRGRDVQPARRLPRAQRRRAAHLRRARERPHEHDHGVRQGRGS